MTEHDRRIRTATDRPRAGVRVAAPPAPIRRRLGRRGFADLDELVVGIRFSHYDWATLDREQVEDAIRGTDSGRFEIRHGLVRARYGHSVALGSTGARRIPPEFLLHGTSADALATVLATGLRPMNRAFVHLTSDPDYAAQVIAAKGGGVVLRVRAKEAAAEGIEFFQANSHVWLAREVPSRYLRMDADAPVSPQARRAATVVVV